MSNESKRRGPPGLRSEWGVFGAHGEGCPDCAQASQYNGSADEVVATSVTVPPGLIERVLVNHQARVQRANRVFVALSLLATGGLFACLWWY